MQKSKGYANTLNYLVLNGKTPLPEINPMNFAPSQDIDPRFSAQWTATILLCTAPPAPKLTSE